MKITDKVNKSIRVMLRKFPVIFICVLFYFTILILYDFLVYTRSLEERLVTYLFLPFICLIVWFSVKLVFYIQFKNKVCSQRFYNAFVICALIVFGLASIGLGVEYFVEGFLVGTFIAPVAFLSVLRAQIIRD